MDIEDLLAPVADYLDFTINSLQSVLFAPYGCCAASSSALSFVAVCGELFTAR